MPTEDPLHALMSRVALRDRAAFQRQYQATCAHLYAVSCRVLRNESRADEVLQEAFMNIWHNASGYNPAVATPMTWMNNIVRNKSIDALRSGKTERATTGELDIEALNVAADDAGQCAPLGPPATSTWRAGKCRQAHSKQRGTALCRVDDVLKLALGR